MRALDNNLHDFNRDDYEDEKELFWIKGDATLDKLYSYNGKIFCVSCISDKQGIAFVSEVTIINGGDVDDTSSTENYECPYCGSIIYDSWEMPSEFDYKCGSCHGESECHMETTVTYCSSPVKRDPDIVSVADTYGRKDINNEI